MAFASSAVVSSLTRLDDASACFLRSSLSVVSLCFSLSESSFISVSLDSERAFLRSSGDMRFNSSLASSSPSFFIAPSYAAGDMVPPFLGLPSPSIHSHFSSMVSSSHFSGLAWSNESPVNLGSGFVPIAPPLPTPVGSPSRGRTSKSAGLIPGATPGLLLLPSYPSDEDARPVRPLLPVPLFLPVLQFCTR